MLIEAHGPITIVLDPDTGWGISHVQLSAPITPPTPESPASRDLTALGKVIVDQPHHEPTFFQEVWNQGCLPILGLVAIVIAANMANRVRKGFRSVCSGEYTTGSVGSKKRANHLNQSKPS